MDSKVYFMRSILMVIFIFFYFGKESGKFWKYEKILNTPEIIGDVDYTEAYLSNSVAYVGDIWGRIYYADPETGDLIDIIDLSRLHIYFNSTNDPNTFFGYYILWGNKKGYFYLFFNNIICYIYHDICIISKYHYNFTGVFISSYYWNGGFVLKFEEHLGSWIHRSYKIYYVKNGEILWNITLSSPMSIWQIHAPDIYILDKNLNVTYRNWCRKFYHSIAVYPFEGAKLSTT